MMPAPAGASPFSVILCERDSELAEGPGNILVILVYPMDKT